jgi:DNA invertase Pin-like site-specific DNA recombinase
MRVAIYARVSTEEQTVENQLPSMRAWVQTRGYEVTEEYTENESAWKAGHQREFARLLNDLRTGKRKYDILLVWALDRLTRQGIEAQFSILNTFKGLGVRVMSIQEPYLETEGEDSPLWTSLTAHMAKKESDRRSIRTKEGLKTAATKGHFPGRPKGSKDKNPRKKSGYYLRWVNKGPVKTHDENKPENEK